MPGAIFFNLETKNEFRFSAQKKLAVLNFCTPVSVEQGCAHRKVTHIYEVNHMRYPKDPTAQLLNALAFTAHARTKRLNLGQIHKILPNEKIKCLEQFSSI